MKGVQVILGALGSREAAALYRDGQLQDLLVDSDAPPPGTIYRARASRPVKGQGGMFFETPDGSAFCRGAKGIAPGSLHLVQVTGYPETGKAIPVTERLLFKSRYCIVTPGAPGINISRQIKHEETRVALRACADAFEEDLGECGIIIRSAAAGADLDAVADDLDATLEVARVVLNDTANEPEKLIEGPGPHALAWRDWPLSPQDTAPDQLEEAYAQAKTGELSLDGGGMVFVEPTRALVAVDVNTGRDTSPAAGLKANLAAARALPRLLRVTGLGGQIVVDFAPMPKKDRRSIEQALRAACRADDVETALVGWTPLGHYELSRKRARAPLHEIVL